MSSYDLWYKRLRWRVRRGSLELNTILIAFLESQHKDFSSVFRSDASSREMFEAFLNQHSDQDLFDWLVKMEFSQKDSKWINYSQYIVRAASKSLNYSV